MAKSYTYVNMSTNGWLREEAVMACFKALDRHFSCCTKENHVTP